MERNGFPVELAIGILVLGGLVSVGRILNSTPASSSDAPTTKSSETGSTFDKPSPKNRSAAPTMKDTELPKD